MAKKYLTRAQLRELLPAAAAAAAAPAWPRRDVPAPMSPEEKATKLAAIAEQRRLDMEERLPTAVAPAG
ncbi:MAG TPA: hypothetical protein PKA13_09000 [Geminicoccaceae bacterium]|nr:hypothetical protein [Geminicoccaceae bacterium]